VLKETSPPSAVIFHAFTILPGIISDNDPYDRGLFIGLLPLLKLLGQHRACVTIPVTWSIVFKDHVVRVHLFVLLTRRDSAHSYTLPWRLNTVVTTLQPLPNSPLNTTCPLHLTLKPAIYSAETASLRRAGHNH
jgi:hypothetical protein